MNTKKQSLFESITTPDVHDFFYKLLINKEHTKILELCSLLEEEVVCKDKDFEIYFNAPLNEILVSFLVMTLCYDSFTARKRLFNVVKKKFTEEYGQIEMEKILMGLERDETYLSF